MSAPIGFRFSRRLGSWREEPASLGAGGRPHTARHMAPTLGQDTAETRRGDSARDGTAALRASRDTRSHTVATGILTSDTEFRETRKPTTRIMSDDGDVRLGPSTDDDDDDAPRTNSHPEFVRGSSEDVSETSLLSNSSRHAEEPEDLTCPITKLMFRDPVFVAGSGNTYERDAIETFWRDRRDRRDPLTNARLKNANLFTNWTKRREVDAWLTRPPTQTPEGWTSRAAPPPLEARDAVLQVLGLGFCLLCTFRDFTGVIAGRAGGQP